MRRLVVAAAWTVLPALLGCGGSNQGPDNIPPPAGDEILVGAGDIAGYVGSDPEATAKLLDVVSSGTVFTTGDNANASGGNPELTYANAYEPTWGRHKWRTKPSPGNHDYEDGGRSYYTYFGEAAGTAGEGYYSYDRGAWHIVSLNSNIPIGAGSAQWAWLRGDLQRSGRTCTLAYWHHPLFSSGLSASATPAVKEVWQVLYEFNVEVVLNGHDHNYERFAPMDPDGRADGARGLREFVVGTGGAPLYGFSSPRANSEVRSSTHGVLKLTLRNGTYTWEFIPVAGQSFRDSGSGSCH